MIFRMSTFAMLVAAGLALASASALPVQAEPMTSAQLPVVAAVRAGDQVRVHLSRTVSRPTASGMYRTVQVEGFNASGASLGMVTRRVPRRTEFASVQLPEGLQGANHIVVRAR